MWVKLKKDQIDVWEGEKDAKVMTNHHSWANWGVNGENENAQCPKQ